jgi:Cu-Zn family superoxide dismutase
MSRWSRPLVRRRTHVLSLATVAALAACGTVDPAGPAAPDGPLARKGAAENAGGNGGHPDQYVLPGATVFPEGITFDQRSGTIYVTSTTDGTIFCGDPKDATLDPCFPGGPGGRTTAVGIDVGSEGQLFVAGGATGRVFVLSGTGAPLATLVGTTGPTFVNDVAVVGGDTAYVTDSQNPVIYRVYRTAGGAYTLEPWLPLAGTAIRYAAGFNLNGIAASPSGRELYVVQSNTGLLFRIDVATRTVTRIDVGDELFRNGDGIEVRGNTLYVVQNAQQQIAEIRLRGDGTSGTLVARTGDPSFRFPTTFVEARGRFLVVNSQFNRRGSGLTPELPFTVSVIKKL